MVTSVSEEHVASIRGWMLHNPEDHNNIRTKALNSVKTGGKMLNVFGLSYT
jgi:hypothetical protein